MMQQGTDWRPSEWDLFYKPREVYSNTEVDVDRALFEAGADAMLRAIRGRGYISGESLRNTKGAPGWAHIGPKSKWYSVPDREVSSV